MFAGLSLIEPEPHDQLFPDVLYINWDDAIEKLPSFKNQTKKKSHDSVPYCD